MALSKRSRLRKLEQAAENLPPAPCEEGGGSLRYIVRFVGDLFVFRGREPCTCDLLWIRKRHEDASSDEPTRSVAPRGRGPTRVIINAPSTVPPPDPELLGPNDFLLAPGGAVYRGSGGA